ncbi:MAG: DNA polymerase III subunit alpha [Planctomycetota bacterium]
MEPFVHLHVHTEYSLLDGANPIKKLVKAAVEDRHEALAITDHGNLFGALEFYTECRKQGVKPILGCEVYVADRSRHEPHKRGHNGYTHLTLLARDAVGWQNLMQLSTAGYVEGMHFRPRIDMELLAQRTAGITCLSGCMSGPVNKRLRVEDEEGAVAMAGQLKEMFGPEHFYLEVMRNGIAVQDKLTEGMVRLKDRIGSPLIATNDIHYLRHEDCAAQDAMLCLHTNSTLDDPNRWRMDTDTLYFRKREEMNRIFSDLPEALRNTLAVAEAIDVELEMGRLRLPVFQPDDGSSPEDCFRRLCEEGFARLYPGDEGEARERMEYEIKVISEMGFISYFLIVWDLCRHAREQGIPVGPGRGSAAGSLVAYVLEITRIDPLEYDLIFERFLNPSRISMPDIDIDFCKDRREEMIRYTRERYGDENVCQIITFGKLKAKNALRDMGRILEIPLSEVDKAAKKIPDGPKVTLEKTLEEEPEFAPLFQATPRHEKWLDLATKVQGLARNAGIHAAGVIIADEPLQEIVPLAKVSGNLTTQWDMGYSEAYGLLKMDFLGLRTLSILSEAARLVAADGEPLPDLDTLPLDDPATYELLQAADTEGVFQLESSGMRSLLAAIKPSTYEDIIAVLALFRPGPLNSGLHETYARRKHGQEPVSFQHPILEPILDETYGVLIYQEQIMRVAQKMGGLSLADADSLRKAMGKKKVELMAQFEDQFLDGAVAQEVPREVAADIWKMMVQFAEYGFNKSHSAGYAMVTYQTAWMKAHHPAAFFAASFTYEADDSDKLRSLIEDARRHDIRLLPPCLNQSEVRFAVTEEGSIRFGLAAIKGVGAGAAEALVEMRGETDAKRFEDLDECLIEGVGHHLNRATFESLAKAGACDLFLDSRLDLLEDLDLRLKQAASVAKDRAKGQGLLFGAGAGPEALPSATPAAGSDGGLRHHPSGAPEEPTPERKKRMQELEKEALGLYLSSHPLDDYRQVLGGVSAFDSRSAKQAPDQTMLSLPGLATQVSVRGTRKDPARKIARMMIEDLYGSTPAVVFPRTYEQLQDMVREDFVGLFHGHVQISNEQRELIVERIEPLGGVDEVRLSGDLRLILAGGDPPVAALQEILSRHPGDSRVRFLVADVDGGYRVVRAGSTWSVGLSNELLQELELLLGPGRAEVVQAKQTTKRSQPAWARG